MHVLEITTWNRIPSDGYHSGGADPNSQGTRLEPNAFVSNLRRPIQPNLQYANPAGRIKVRTFDLAPFRLPFLNLQLGAKVDSRSVKHFSIQSLLLRRHSEDRSIETSG